MLNALPNVNRSILNKLFEWFSFISLTSDNVHSKMDDIAETFGDALLKPHLHDDDTETYTPTIKKLIFTLMENFHYLFNVINAILLFLK